MAASKLQVAMRRNALKHHGEEFVARLVSMLGFEKTALRLLSAEESFDLQERGQAILQPIEARRDIQWDEALKSLRELDAHESCARLIVFLAHYPDFPIELPFSPAIEKMRGLVGFDGDLVSAVLPDASAGFIIDPNSDGTVNVFMRGSWCDALGKPRSEGQRA